MSNRWPTICECFVTESAASRTQFRVAMRRRGGYDHQDLVDVQLQNITDGSLIWSQTFSHPKQADTFADTVRDDLKALDDASFRRKYAIPLSA